jgi:hypothetical protein
MEDLFESSAMPLPYRRRKQWSCSFGQGWGILDVWTE